MKAKGHFDRCYLKGAGSDAANANAILAAAGCNLRLVLAWLRMMLLRLIMIAL